MIPFISWGAKWCSIQSLHIVILTRKKWFSKHPKSYNVNFGSNARPPVWTEVHLARAREQRWTEKCMRARRAPVGRKTRAPVSKVREEKSGWISLQSLVNWLVGRSAKAGLWTCKLIKSTGKQIKPKWGRNLYQLPSMVANLFALFSSMYEQKVSAYMPSWALLGMTAVM